MKHLACLAALGLVACTPAPERADAVLGARSFQANCAVCHGADGRGAGPMARDLLVMPPSLTGLAERQGGPIPAEFIVGVVEGHARSDGFSGAMPEFSGAGMGTGPMVDVAGLARPVSAPMADLLAYLQTIQD